jgi:hypothetical protein
MNNIGILTIRIEDGRTGEVVEAFDPNDAAHLLPPMYENASPAEKGAYLNGLSAGRAQVDRVVEDGGMVVYTDDIARLNREWNEAVNAFNRVGDAFVEIFGGRSE